MSFDAIDAIVVGGGPAGLTAATWLARHRRSVVVIDSGEQRNRWVRTSHGYLSRDAVAPADLLEAAGADLSRYEEAEIRPGRVVDARGDADAGFEVDLEDGSRLRARRVVLATGVGDVFPDVAGFFDHYGTDVFHCPTCDGYEARDRQVVAFGWDAKVAGFARELLHWAADVTVVTNGHRFEGDERHRQKLADAGIDLVEDVAVELVGAPGRLERVRLKSGADLPCTMAFFSTAHRPHNELARRLGCEVVGEGCVVVDDEGQTTVPGVYAAGDLTPGLQLVQVAAGKGA